MNAIRYVFLSCCLIGEFSMFLFGIAGMAVFLGNPSPDVPIAMVPAVTVCAAVQICITIASYRKVRLKKEFPVLPGFLLKAGAFMIMLGISWFALEIPEAGWFGLVLGGILAVLGMLWPKIAGTGARRAPAEHTASLPVFRADKAEWAWEDAAIEYLRLHGRNIERNTPEGSRILREIAEAAPGGDADSAAGSDASDAGSLSDRIFDYAAMPIAYFLGWLIRSDLVSSAFKDMHDAGSLRAVRGGSLSPLEILRDMDYVLAREDIAPEALAFADSYYNTEEPAGAFSHRTQRYFFDYYKVVCSGFDVPRYYCVDFEREKFQKLADILDRRYREFTEGGFDEEQMRSKGQKLRSQYFDTEAELLWEPGALQRYVRLCADAYENMGGRLVRDLGEHLIEFCPEGGEMEAEAVLRKFEPAKVVVLNPEELCDDQPDGESEAVPAYVILGGSEWEREHGISVTVIGEYVVNCGFYADAESPWEEDLWWKYRIRRDAEDGRVCAGCVIPERFGGQSTADNQAVIPESAQLRRQQYDDRVEALYILGQADKYDCRLTYDGGAPNYMFISAEKGDRRVYADSLPLR